MCVGREFREGNQSPSAGMWEFGQSCEAALPVGKRIYFRSDSAAYQAAATNQYHQPGRSFSVAADLAAAVKHEIGNPPKAAWQPYRAQEGIATDGEMATAGHSMKGTEQPFRPIILRWANPQPNLFAANRYGYHAMATNREESVSAVIWKHNERGNSENWHKEPTVGWALEQMRCGQFEANVLYFAMGVLAHNLAQRLKRPLLPASYRRARWRHGSVSSARPSNPECASPTLNLHIVLPKPPDCCNPPGYRLYSGTCGIRHRAASASHAACAGRDATPSGIRPGASLARRPVT